jgi:predicted nucleic acid-binding protein
MLVVADSSPLIVLLNIDSIQILPSLFGDVRIPPQVAVELAQSNRPTLVQEFIGKPPVWLQIVAPSLGEQIPLLQEGEIAAINLAKELKADLLLINELQGRRVAAERKIPLTGTIGVLEMAAKAKLLDLREAFDRVKQTDFWISPKLLDERLKIFEKR